jgi:hypothetical protein
MQGLRNLLQEKFSGGGENFAYFVPLGQNITIIT